MNTLEILLDHIRVNYPDTEAEIIEMTPTSVLINQYIRIPHKKLDERTHSQPATSSWTRSTPLYTTITWIHEIDKHTINIETVSYPIAGRSNYRIDLNNPNSLNELNEILETIFKYSI